MAAESEIFERLSRIEQIVARIDERTSSHSAAHADHEGRIRKLELEGAKQKGVMAVIGLGASGLMTGLLWLLNHFFGGGN